MKQLAKYLNLRKHEKTHTKLKSDCTMPIAGDFYSAIPNIRKCSMLIFTFIAIITIFLFIISFAIRYVNKINVVSIEINQPPVQITSDKFLSIALDSSTICNGFRHFDMNNPKLSKLMQPLSPGYFRIGGNLADKLLFTEKELSLKYYFVGIIDGGDCSNYFDCGKSVKPTYTMTGKEWLKLHNMVTANGFEVVFDLNVLRRFSNGTWDYSNAELLINFSQLHNLSVHWELGNEPNAFKRQFHVNVAPQQLAADFNTLHKILQKYPLYRKSLLIGPDVTRPQENHKESMEYLSSFLSNGGNIVDVVSFHHYYYSGNFVKPYDFVETSLFKILEDQIGEVQTILKALQLENKTLWIGETADCWGSGASGYSNNFISTYIWLYKLGVSAKMGVSVVVRQSIVQGFYALIDDEYNPTPNWWLSVFYKRLVGTKVLFHTSIYKRGLEIYCHCASKGFYNSVVVYAFNVGSKFIKLRFELDRISENTEINEFILSPGSSIFSNEVMFNGKLLQLGKDNKIPPLLPRLVPGSDVTFPPYSIGFWIIQINGASPCE